MIEVIGAPFDLCGMRLGSRLGPAAIRLAGLLEELEKIDHEVWDAGDIPVDLRPSTGDGLRNFEPLLQAVKDLREATLTALRREHLPLILGGEHTLAVASVSAALEHYGDNLGVLWIDAHADINTPGISETGNIHGMPIAALCGEPSGIEGGKDRDWRRLLDALGKVRLQPDHVAWYGLRDVDRAEVPRLKGLPVTMHDIDRKGIENTVNQVVDRYIQLGIDHLWISFDIDALDPVLAPGTGTAVRGGLTFRESQLVAEILHERMSAAHCPFELVGVDFVETNPIHDQNNQTATVGTEWIASLFGKTILG
jgi:arginase